jgi:hypothetical protein
MEIPSLWALRTSRRVLATLRGQRIPPCGSLHDLETVLRAKVRDTTTPKLRRAFARTRAVLVSMPLWLPLVTAGACSLFSRDAETISSISLAAFVVGATVGTIWLLFSLDGGIDARFRLAVSTSNNLTGAQLLEPFGGVSALPMRLILDKPSYAMVKEDTIGMAVLWWWGQLDDQQRQVLEHQGRTDMTAADVLAAFSTCQVGQD